MYSILLKLGMWLLPRVLTSIVELFELTIRLVGLTEGTIQDPAERRNTLLADLKREYGIFPEPALRILIECCVILYGLGVRHSQIQTIQHIVRDEDLIATISTEEKRNSALNQIKNLFPELPERLARLLLEFTVAKIRLGIGV